MTETDDRAIDWYELRDRCSEYSKVEKLKWGKRINEGMKDGVLTYEVRPGEPVDKTQYAKIRRSGRELKLYPIGPIDIRPTTVNFFTRAAVTIWLRDIIRIKEPNPDLMAWLKDAWPGVTQQAAVSKSTSQKDELVGDKRKHDRRNDQLKVIKEKIQALELKPLEISPSEFVTIKTYCVEHHPKLFTKDGFKEAWYEGNRRGLFGRVDKNKYSRRGGE